MIEYNIAKKDGTLMLCTWVPTYSIAIQYLAYYLRKYSGEIHPDYGFHIVERRVEL